MFYAAISGETIRKKVLKIRKEPALAAPSSVRHDIITTLISL